MRHPIAFAFLLASACSPYADTPRRPVLTVAGYEVTILPRNGAARIGGETEIGGGAVVSVRPRDEPWAGPVPPYR